MSVKAFSSRNYSPPCADKIRNRETGNATRNIPGLRFFAIEARVTKWRTSHTESVGATVCSWIFKNILRMVYDIIEEASTRLDNRILCGKAALVQKHGSPVLMNGRKLGRSCKTQDRSPPCSLRQNSATGYYIKIDAWIWEDFVKGECQLNENGQNMR